ncbi:hypothetical protein [Telluribacter sp. SYSU D00476]|uniref:hypothetical protein n=1 Tax=Telluribacter sp. SYSU D00476 TaxID=2811430 RepID=UPI001FF597DB|nr:hypothetical protein [Telluribacter sp. SYSU D00476]
MRRTILALSVITIAFVLKSCAPASTLKHTALKGKHLEEPYVVITDKPFEEVWNNVVDVLAQSGFPIRFIDKENGLVVSERSSLINDFTFEDRLGKLENPNALVVLPTVSIWTFGDRIYPTSLTGVASIRVRKLGENKTKINVNLNALNVDVIEGVERNTTEDLRKAQLLIAQQIRSTGLFEYKITELVK